MNVDKDKDNEGPAEPQLDGPSEGEMEAPATLIVADQGTAVKGMAAGGSAGTDAIRHIHQYEPMPPGESKVKLERGQKGTYAWEVTVSGSDADAILWKLRDLDSRLRREYCGGE